MYIRSRVTPVSLVSRTHGMTEQDERVPLQAEPEDNLLRRAAVRIPIPIPPGAAAQRSRLDADPVPDSVAGARELVEPDLPDGIPPAVRVAPEELLAASAGAVDAAHDTEQRRAGLGRAELGRDRAPHRVVAGLVTGVPHGAHSIRRLRLEKDGFLFGHGVPRRGAAGGVLG